MPSAHLSFRLKPSRPIKIVARATGIVCAHLKTRRKDHAVQFKFLAVRYHAVFGETLNPSTIGVDKVNARQIKAR